MVTWAPLIAAIAAAFVALLGYWLTNRAKRLDAKAKAYADALSAIEAYKSLPYRISRRITTTDPKDRTANDPKDRTTNDPKDEAYLQHLVGDVQRDIAFYRRWLALESATVGLAFEALANRVMSQGAENRRKAWSEMADPTTFSYGYEYGDKLEQDVCLAAMRKDLGYRRQRGIRRRRHLP
jgi:hypothetical protein